MTAISALPQRQTAQSRVVLETPLAVQGTPRTARPAQDVQHLQIVLHHLTTDAGKLAGGDFDTADQAKDLDAKITSGRNKPTNLTITAHGSAAATAQLLARAATEHVMEISKKLQQLRIEESLKHPKSLVAQHALELAKTQRHLATVEANSVANAALRVTDLERRAQAIETRIRDHTSAVTPSDPVLLSLQTELAKAKLIYSDNHPKVRLLQARIETLPAAPKVVPIDLATLENHLQELRGEISSIKSNQAKHESAAAQVAQAQSLLDQSKAALAETRSRGEQSVVRLKIVEDATLLSASLRKKQLALMASLALLAACLSLGLAVLRIRFDERVRRPTDLTKGLGLTPFATIPHLGPQLT